MFIRYRSVFPFKNVLPLTVVIIPYIVEFIFMGKCKMNIYLQYPQFILVKRDIININHIHEMNIYWRLRTRDIFIFRKDCELFGEPLRNSSQRP